jgi:hypothetical protein
MAPLKYERLWIACGIGFVMVVIYLSLTPEPPDLGLPEGFKYGHLIAYSWLMFWFALIYRAKGRRLLFGAAFCALGIVLEYLQGLTDTRGFEYADMLINAGGVAIGLALGATPLQNVLRVLEKRLSGNAVP